MTFTAYPAGEVTDQVMEEEGKYFRFPQNSDWWVQSGTQEVDPLNYYRVLSSTDPFGNTGTYEYDTNNLAVTTTLDPLANKVSAIYNYRVLQPEKVIDPNENETEIKFDILGMVVGTAISGSKGEGDSFSQFIEDPDQALIDEYLANPDSEAAHQLLGTATTRLIYTIDRYQSDKTPNVVASIARETHVSDLDTTTNPIQKTKLQHSFVYADTAGQEVLMKVKAEPGLVPERDLETGELTFTDGKPNEVQANPRWVGNGRTIFDNKGNPIKQYEPFYSATHLYETGSALREIGVTPILRYDPLGRVMRTDLPDGTFTKVEFTPWIQTTWDQNDTVLESQWFQDRQGLGASDFATVEAVSAARKAQVHANTPETVHLDTLGRPFLAITDNGEFGKYETRTTLDIEGNPEEIEDARGNIVEKKLFNVMGQTMRVASMDEGVLPENPRPSDENKPGLTQVLTNVAGNPIRAWDAMGSRFRSRYDKLQRQREKFVKQVDQDEFLYECTFYGEQLDTQSEFLDNNEENKNLQLMSENNMRGQVIMAFDGAGLVSGTEFDFKGLAQNPKRRLTTEYQANVRWDGLANNDSVIRWEKLELDAQLLNSFDNDVHTTTSQFDALGRVIRMKMPDDSIVVPGYNDANLLEKVNVTLGLTQERITFVENIDYDEKGQRKLIRYGNQVTTTYDYDNLSSRLRELVTNKQDEAKPIQKLTYTYDPVGNITHVRDDAIKTIYFGNQEVEPVSEYTYDAIYQLRIARGREQIQEGKTISTQTGEIPKKDIPHRSDLNALQNYSQTYDYDKAGNILSLIHKVNEQTKYHRNLNYQETNNRLKEVWYGKLENEGTAQKEIFSYDAAGSMQGMQHLPAMNWDFKNQLHYARTSVTNQAEVFFVYDASGERVRKVAHRTDSLGNLTGRIETVYLGGIEIYREYGVDQKDIRKERKTLHIMDDSRRIAIVEALTIENGKAIINPISRQRYQFGNHLGSATLELDKDSNEISYEEHHPFGTTSFHSFNRSSEVSAKRYRYTGKEKDDETNLYYHGARYYVCWLGRWTTVDPIGIGDGLNKYLYANNSPIVYMDSSGTSAEKEPAWSASEGFGGESSVNSDGNTEIIGTKYFEFEDELVIGSARKTRPKPKKPKYLPLEKVAETVLQGRDSRAWAGYPAMVVLAVPVIIVGGAPVVAGVRVAGSRVAVGAVATSRGATAAVARVDTVLIAGGEALTAYIQSTSPATQFSLAVVATYSAADSAAHGEPIIAGVGRKATKAAKAGKSVMSTLKGFLGGGKAPIPAANIPSASTPHAGFSGRIQNNPKADLAARVAAATKAAKKAGVPVTRIPSGPGGRLGNPATRAQNQRLATDAVNRGGTNVGFEEYLPDADGGTKGSVWWDVVATFSNYKAKIQTVDTLADGVTPSKRELENAWRGIDLLLERAAGPFAVFLYPK